MLSKKKEESGKRQMPQSGYHSHFLNIAKWKINLKIKILKIGFKQKRAKIKIKTRFAQKIRHYRRDLFF